MGILETPVDPVIARGITRIAGSAPVWSPLPAGSTNVITLGPALDITGWGFYAGTPAAQFNRLVIPFQCTQSEYVPMAFLVRVRHTDKNGSILASGTCALVASSSKDEFADVKLSATVTTSQPVWIEFITDGRAQFYNVTLSGGSAVYPTPTYPTTEYYTKANLSSPSAFANSVSQYLELFYAYYDDGGESFREVASDLGGDFAITSWPGRIVSVHPSIAETASIGVINWTANVSSSTFSGWGWYAGNQTTRFNAVAVWLKPFDAALVPTVGIMRVRRMPSDQSTWGTTNPASWQVIAESKNIALGLTVSAWRQVVFALNRGVTGRVWIEFQTDGRIGISMNTAGSGAPIYATPPSVSYVTSARLTPPTTWSASVTHYTPHCRLGLADFRGGRIAVRSEFSAQIGASSSSSNPVVYISLPTNAQNVLPALEGRELNVYFDASIWASVPLDQLCIDVTCTKGSQYERWWRYTPTSGDAGTTTFTLTVYTKDRATQLATASATLKTVALAYPSTPVTRKVLMIGDSTWANGIVGAELVNLFNGDTKYTLTLVGSNDGSVNDSGAVSRTVRCDAVSGWSFAMFTTDAATAWTEIGGTARTGSPFSFSGAFNFASYLAAQSITMSSGDWVLINLGINDVFSYTDDATLSAQMATMSTQLAAWITSIKAAVSGIKIGICVTIPPSASQDAFGTNYTSGQTLRRYEQNVRLWRATILANYDSTITANVFVIPYHVNLDRQNSFPTASVALNSRNATTYTQQSNSVHPANAGYWQLADLLRSWLKANE